MNSMVLFFQQTGRCIFYGVSVLFLVLIGSTSVLADEKRGTLSGRVSDSGGGAVVGATVTLRQSTVGFEVSAQSDASGTFQFTELVPGEYSLSAKATNYALSSKPITISEGAVANLDLILQPGTFTEDITLVSGSIAGVPEILQRIPGTVDILEPKTLQQSRLFNFNEALRKVSGINVRDEEGFGLRPNIGIRGLNPTRSTKVLLLEDGIPLAYAPYGDNASYYHPPVERFESIEVLKGSGQIVYGPVTVGGVVNYVTPMPPTKPSGSLMLTGGNRDYFNGIANYGGTWGNTGFLVDYMRKQGEGSRVNLRHKLNDLNVKLVTTLNARNFLTFKANYYGEDSQVTYSGLTLKEFQDDPRQNPFQNDAFEIDRFGFSGTHNFLITSNFVMNTNLYGSIFKRDWWRQSSNSTQRPNDSADPDCGGLQNLNTDCGNEGRLREFYTWGIAPQFRLSHNLFGIRNEADFGFRAHFETQDRMQLNGDSPRARTGIIVEDNIRKNKAFSGYIQNRFILGKFTVTPGVRIEKIHYERTNNLANAGAGITGSTDVTQVIPGLGVAYAVNDRTTVFAGVHRGFAPPRTEDIINNTTGGAIDLDPELSWNYEAGIRSLPLQGLRLDAAYFRMNYENQIVPASLAGGSGTTLTNGGETRHQGIEFNGRLDTGTLLRSEHNFFVRFNYTYVGTAEFVGRRFSNIPGFSTVSVSGNRLPYSPNHLATTGFGYSHQKGIDVFVESVYVSDQFGDDLNTIESSADGQRGLIPGYTIWNATLNYRAEPLHSTFFITCKNLLDDTFIVDRARGILPSSPRLVQAGFKWNF
ncbi:MAG: TonB-dependent receptor [Acidobacteria bacterium]|nr:TonB-dependent receptor [Acidobacteriota bacterium]